MASNRQPAQVFAPGEFLADELEARGWTVGDLVTRGKSRHFTDAEVTGILRGEPMDAYAAMAIGRALGTGPVLWMNLEAAYRTAPEHTRAPIRSGGTNG